MVIFLALRNMVNKSCVRWNGISPPASSSYRHARLVECGIDTQAGNKNRLSRIMFCLRYVSFISCPFRSFPINRFQYNTRSTTNALRTRETYSLLSFCVCYMNTEMARFIVPEITETCLSSLVVFLCFIANCEKSQIL